jgi:hypothetical protein
MTLSTGSWHTFTAQRLTDSGRFELFFVLQLVTTNKSTTQTVRHRTKYHDLPSHLQCAKFKSQTLNLSWFSSVL